MVVPILVGSLIGIIGTVIIVLVMSSKLRTEHDKLLFTWFYQDYSGKNFIHGVDTEEFITRGKRVLKRFICRGKDGGKTGLFGSAPQTEILAEPHNVYDFAIGELSGYKNITQIFPDDIKEMTPKLATTPMGQLIYAQQARLKISADFLNSIQDDYPKFFDLAYSNFAGTLSQKQLTMFKEILMSIKTEEEKPEIKKKPDIKT